MVDEKHSTPAAADGGAAPNAPVQVAPAPATTGAAAAGAGDASAPGEAPAPGPATAPRPGFEGGGGRRRRRRRRRRGGRPDFAPAPGGAPLSPLEACRAVARRRFHIERLYPEQEAAMEAVLAGKDTMVVMPTGFGKSLIYQVPAMVLDRPTVVVSPLIALMVDQENALKRKGVPVIRLDSTLPAAERRAALERLARGGRLVVLTTPETLESEKTAPFFEQARPALLAVDEAHCISEWGHDFRPSYLRLHFARKRLGGPPVLALTATATPKVREDIAARLGLQNPVVITAPPHRPNLILSVEVVPGNFKPAAAARILKRLRRPGIVYCSTTVAVDQIWRALTRARIPAARYHGKMRAEERALAQRWYMRPSRRIVMVATSAFGMGIDKPNIRYILHFQAPGSLEQYVQEAGRAGRDGLPSHCILLFDPADLEIQERLESRSRPNARQLVRVAEALAAWAGENKPVSTRALALSAEIPANTCSALCAKLEEVGLIELTEEGYVVRVPADALVEGAKDLAGRLETLRREDARRLAAVAEYAQTDECRSVFIRKYFGEENPPKCNKCDRCRAAARTAAAVAAADRAEQMEEERRIRRARAALAAQELYEDAHEPAEEGVGEIEIGAEGEEDLSGAGVIGGFTPDEDEHVEPMPRREGGGRLDWAGRNGGGASSSPAEGRPEGNRGRRRRGRGGRRHDERRPDERPEGERPLAPASADPQASAPAGTTRASLADIPSAPRRPLPQKERRAAPRIRRKADVQAVQAAPIPTNPPGAPGEGVGEGAARPERG